jgi:hypothetical protein
MGCALINNASVLLTTTIGNPGMNRKELVDENNSEGIRVALPNLEVEIK